jgi:hypothetical protein
MHATNNQILMFRSIFTGRSDVYGTYDPATRRTWQVKQSVTDRVIRDHLEGRRPFGVYLLDGERVAAAVVDFDRDVPQPPLAFQAESRKLCLPVYIERSKSKGYHVWMFFQGRVVASKARQVLLGILERIKMQGTEIFPKQDRLTAPGQFGNFINAPLFGQLLPQGRSLFLNEALEPYADQWEFLRSIVRVSKIQLNRIIATELPHCVASRSAASSPLDLRKTTLPPCAERMLREGVSFNQRIACFRLACQLRKTGVELEPAVRILNGWALRNRPLDGKGVIKPSEVQSQTHCAYQGRLYRSCGCEDPTVMPFCDPSCHVRRG